MSRIHDAVEAAYDAHITASASHGSDTNTIVTPEATPDAGDLQTIEGDPSHSDETTPEVTNLESTDIPNTGSEAHPAEAAPRDESHPKAIKERVLRENPELADQLSAILEPTLREMERGMNKQFEAAAALKREAVDHVVVAQVVKDIPQDQLLGLKNLYVMAKHGNPQQMEMAANTLYQMQEEIRAQLPSNINQYSSQAPQQDINNLPEVQQMRQLLQHTQIQQVQSQINGAFENLKSEWGGKDIPLNQRNHVIEELQKLGINNLDAALQAIPMVWKAHYGADYKTVEALKKGQGLKTQKEGLGISGGISPGSSTNSRQTQPKSMRERLAAICDDAGRK